MNYTVQIFTGGFYNRNYTTDELLKRLKDITGMITVDKVIIGWNLEAEQYRAVNEYLSNQGIDSYLWLPVFSEIGVLKEVEKAVDIAGRPVEKYILQEGEAFEFYCPTSRHNQDMVIEVYQEYFSGCGFTGVFLDKIRTQSFIGGYPGVMSCCCSRCREQMERLNVDLQELSIRVTKKRSPDLFGAKSFSHQHGFSLVSQEFSSFINAKQNILTNAVKRLIHEFKQQGLKIGLDVFFPALAPFVGQDIIALGGAADFVKPMMYRRTEAPAGIPFEYQSLKRAVGREAGATYDSVLMDKLLEPMDQEFLRKQLEVLTIGGDISVLPGIEVNYNADIARTDPEYVLNSLKAVSQAGCTGAVLSWDIMQAPLKHLEILSTGQKG